MVGHAFGRSFCWAPVVGFKGKHADIRKLVLFGPRSKQTHMLHIPNN